MDQNTVITFTRNGMGEAPPELQVPLAVKFLNLILESGGLPSKILFYTDGVKLAVEGSPAIPALMELEKRGVELILCSTCLNYFQLTDQVRVGIAGGMPDILEALSKAEKVVAL